jgi:hypothetical protein
MVVTMESGRRITIPLNHSVFQPTGDQRSGDVVDPETVDVLPLAATRLYRGQRIIVDNQVEIVAEVA